MKSCLSYTRIICLCISLVLGMGSVYAADPDSKPVKTRMRVSFYQEDYESGWLEIKVTYREGKSLNPVDGGLVEIFIVTEGEEQLIGNISTDEKGKARFYLEPEVMNRYLGDENLVFELRLIRSEKFQSCVRSLEVRRALLEINLLIKDSIPTIKARLTVPDSGGVYVPLEDQEVKFYVKRYFGMLPIGKAYNLTSDDGTVSNAFPADLPGDEDGIVGIVVRIEDHEEFGTISINRSADWGVPVRKRDILNQRTLWSTRDKVPYFLLFLANSIIILTWGVIIYLIIQIININKLGKTHIDYEKEP